jgi:hypothetical protein
MEDNKELTYKFDNGKFIEFNEKAFADTKQIIDNVNTDRFNNFIKNCHKLDKNSLDAMSRSFPEKGKKLYLEVIVEDSYMGSVLYDWMYSESNFDKSKGLLFFGLNLDAIHFSMPSGYTEEEKYIIKRLYHKIFGNE